MQRAVGAILALLFALPAPAATGIVAEPPRDRVDAAAEVVRELRRIVTPEGVEEPHLSLFDGSNCGISIKGKKAFGVQYHPEASPGPQDSFYLFEKFVGMLG